MNEWCHMTDNQLISPSVNFYRMNCFLYWKCFSHRREWTCISITKELLYIQLIVWTNLSEHLSGKLIGSCNLQLANKMLRPHPTGYCFRVWMKTGVCKLNLIHKVIVFFKYLMLLPSYRNQDSFETATQGFRKRAKIHRFEWKNVWTFVISQ